MKQYNNNTKNEKLKGYRYMFVKTFCFQDDIYTYIFEIKCMTYT